MMRLFYRKFRLWFEEAAIARRLQHAVHSATSKFHAHQHSIEAVLTGLLAITLATLSPLSANATYAEKLPTQSFTSANYPAMKLQRDSEIKVVKKEVVLGTPEDAKQYAQTLIGSDSQWQCLHSLWMKESGWRVDASNSSSGSYGIPQALPGNKMESFGEDWETSYATQINWGLNYIERRYGTPCEAWAFSQENNWY